jgi:1-deoxy-D-xylulose-5-phosphate reductoisomerase
MKQVTLLGSTGSIGVNTLDVIQSNSSSYQVFALAAGKNAERLCRQIIDFRPRVAVVSDAAVRDQLCRSLDQAGLPRSSWPDLLAGPAALTQIATAEASDIVVSAIVGVAGLEATYEAVKRGKRVGLANKEVLVSGGSLVMQAVRTSGAELIPIDSEHNGAHQALRAGRRNEVSRLILTASGGPFRTWTKESLASVTPQQALNHPTWRMGNRITIDSATLMNKGFEVIEACWLFDFPPAQVEVVIHPQSSVHAMVEYTDGSIIAQVSATDMRMPIQYALTYPKREAAPVPKVDWTQARRWDFAPPDFEKFPLLKLAYECQQTGGSATCILNAADEIAVEAFLQGRIGFLQIGHIVREVLARAPQRTPRSIGEILEADLEARAIAGALVAEYAGSKQLFDPARA